MLPIDHAEFVLPGEPLSQTISFFIDTLGFQLDSIVPADDPRAAQLSGHGMHIFLDSKFKGEPALIRLRLIADCAPDALIAPNGTRIEFTSASPALVMPTLEPRLSIELLRGDGAWKAGRAGMQYRDLIPDRQGGQFIASHIRIPTGGPVGDHVHHHAVRLQLIYCYRGWVRLVYEDQGEPFLMQAGDCVLQPPHIRHRVLEASDGLEVIEIGSPAEHLTHLDHQMTLPTGQCRPLRDFGGQRFNLHRAGEAAWVSDAATGVTTSDLGIAAATNGMADAQVMRTLGNPSAAIQSIQDKTFEFAFVLEGAMRLQVDDGESQTLRAGDAFVVPQGMSRRISDCSSDWQMLQVSLPG